MHRTDIKDLSVKELEEKVVSLGDKPYRGEQIYKWLYQAGARAFDDMTDIPQVLREGLKKSFRISHLIELDSKRSISDGTAKYLFKLEDSNTIETVFLPEPERCTICLSSQVGCKYACSFCASAPFGFVRNLTRSEILNEVIAVRERNPSVRVSNLVFMGIGEPLDNYDNVLAAIRVFNDPAAFNIGARKMTISTCGIIPGMKRLAEEKLQVELSVSLHSADDAVRSKLLPINKRYPLKDLMRACREYVDRTDRIITFEYILIKGVNSSRDDAVKLAKLLDGLKCKVNTISYNEIRAKGYATPTEAETKIFIRTLKAEGVNALHRKSKGEDIDAGCGQLRISRL